MIRLKQSWNYERSQLICVVLVEQPHHYISLATALLSIGSRSVVVLSVTSWIVFYISRIDTMNEWNMNVFLVLINHIIRYQFIVLRKSYVPAYD